MTGKAVQKAIQKKGNGKPAKKDEDEAYTASKSAKGKKKGPEDENKIKRPLSAFFMFCNERRETLKKEEPSMQMGQ